MAKYEVTVSRTTVETRVITINAEDRETADAAALTVAQNERGVDWDFYDDSFETVDVHLVEQ